jgi:hypothetical protein
MLFSDRSLWTMLHGLVFSSGALILLVTALFSLRAMAVAPGAVVPLRQARALSWLLVAIAVLLWLAVIGGTYIVFPLYRATPPEGITALAEYPRAFLLANQDTRWLHAFGMEIKEHMPWMAAMLTTAVAVVGWRHRATLLADPALRRLTGVLLGLATLLVVGAALLGTFINKVAPLW